MFALSLLLLLLKLILLAKPSVYILLCVPSCELITRVRTRTIRMHTNGVTGMEWVRVYPRVAYVSGRVEIFITGMVRVRITVVCYGYGSGSKIMYPRTSSGNPYTSPSHFPIDSVLGLRWVYSYIRLARGAEGAELSNQISVLNLLICSPAR